MKKILGITIVSIILLVLGIRYVYGQEWGLEKLVLQKDVRIETLNENQLGIKVEKLDLKLDEGEYFTPSFYMGDEIYGNVGIELSNTQPLDKFPVGGMFKGYLYKLQKDNILAQTPKKVFSFVYGSKVVGLGLHEQEGKIYTIDYEKDDEPKEINELYKALKTVEFSKDNSIISEVRINERTTYLYIMTIVQEKGSLLYFYDRENNKLYKRKGDVPNQSDVIYIDALKSLIRIDQDLKCYKVAFEGDEFDFIEFMDLRPYVEGSETMTKNDGIRFIPVSGEEILIETLNYFRKDGYFSFHPIRETKSLSMFNFKTNQFQELFTAQEKQHVNVTYAGNVEAMGGKLVIIDEFEDDNGYISPRERLFKIIKDGQLSTVFKEDIQGEGNTLNPYLRVIVKGDGKEIFLMKDKTMLMDNIETNYAAVYKRYIIGD